MTWSGRRRARLALALGAACLTPTAAAAAPLGLGSCGENRGVHQCSGLARTWDGVPLDTTVTLPAKGGSGLPLVVEIHGLGNSKYEYLDPASRAYTDNAFNWAKRGYAVLTYTARGFWGSCGSPDARLANPVACARGYTHLADARYEGRDTQRLIGRLVDEGVVDRRRIGVTGDSYGGGQTLILAALRDRVALPDGRLIRWRSPRGTPLRIAAAAPVIPWSDLVYAIAPNGTTLTYAIPPAAAPGAPVGVLKASVANGVFAATQFAVGPGQPVGQPFVPGRPMGYLAPPRVDPEADVTTWITRSTAGPPYRDPLARSIVRTLQRYHSGYGIDASRPPAPLLMASGFTDDLFPVDEVTRVANRTQRDHPETPLSLLLGDFGHMRASNKPRDRDLLLDAVHAWLDHHVRGDGRKPRTGVTALTQTCPRTAPSRGPFRAATFGALARGEVRYSSSRSKTLSPLGGDPRVGAAIDPVAGGGNACAATGARDQPGTATHRLPAAPRRGYTLLGAPTVIAGFELGGDPDTAQVAARLWDVTPDGSSQRLVARGLYRPSGRGKEVFQLHANGYRFEPGHIPKLELLGNDIPYGLPAAARPGVEVKRLELRLPVREAPDCVSVLPAAAPVVPRGQQAVRRPARAGRDCTGEAARGGADPTSGGGAPATPGAARGETAEEGAARSTGRADSPLPLTGLRLAAVVAAGLALALTGAALRRRRYREAHDR